MLSILSNSFMTATRMPHNERDVPTPKRSSKDQPWGAPKYWQKGVDVSEQP